MPAARLLHTASVGVETCYGRVYRGAFLGTCWAGLPERREQLVLVREEKGECFAIDADLVRHIEVEPGGLPSGEAGPALAEFASAIRKAGAPWDAVSVSERLDDTTDVLATVWFVDHHCQPGPDPRPKETRSPLAPPAEGSP